MSTSRSKLNSLRDWEEEERELTMEELIRVNNARGRKFGYGESTSGRGEGVSVPVSHGGSLSEDQSSDSDEGESDGESDSSLEVIVPDEPDLSVEDRVPVEEDIDVTQYPPPPGESPNVAARMRGKVEPTLDKALKNFPKFRKDFGLEGFRLYYRSSLRAKALHGGIIVCKPYFTCGFRIPMGDLTVSCFNQWYKAPNQFAGNAYTYLSVLEALNSTGEFHISPIDVESLFSVRKTNNSYFTFYRRSGVPPICHLDSKPHYLESAAMEIVGDVTKDGRLLLFSRPFNTSPIPEPTSEGFTAEAQKVIRFSNLQPPTRRQFLRDQLGDNVDHLFPDNLTVGIRSPPMASDELPPVPGLTRKRKANPNVGPAKSSRQTPGASGSGTPAVMASQSSASRQVSHSSPSTAPNVTSQSVGVISTQPLSADPTAPAGATNQAATTIGSRVPRVTDSSAIWKPIFKDLSGRLLTIGHTGRDCSSVAGLIENNVTLPRDVEFFEKQTSGYLVLFSANSRYNATAADRVLSTRFLRYEDYINGICESLGCTREDSIVERLNLLKAENDKAKNAMNRIGELEKELENARGVEEKVAALTRDLDKSKVEVTVVQASLDRAKADKDVAVKELVEANLALAREKERREEAEKKIEDWRPNYTLGCRKIASLLDVSVNHMKKYRPFRDEIRPFMAEFESDTIEEFDEDTATMDRGENIESPVVDKNLVVQTDDLVDITEAQRRDEQRPTIEE